LIVDVKDRYLWKSAMGDIYNQVKGIDSHIPMEQSNNLNE